MTSWIGERVDAVIFDNDGTLVDSEPLTLGLLSTMATEAGAEVYPDDAQRFMGGDINLVIDAVEQRSDTTIDRDAFFDEFRSRQYDEIRKGLVEIAGASQLLKALVANGTPFAVASNAPMAKMSLSLESTGLDSYFTPDTMVSAYDVGVWKPDPAIFHTAAVRLGVPIERCVVIEDSPPGIAAAIASGGHPIALGNHRVNGDETVTRVQSLREAQHLLLANDQV